MSAPDRLTGQIFGRLVVIKRIRNNKWGSALWLCKCDCGKTVEVASNSLRSGNTKSCGCLRKEVAQQQGKMSKFKFKFKDLTDQRFGRLVAIKRVGTKWGQALWLCKCDCGKTTEAIVSSLNSGRKKSCGCLKSSDLTGQRFGRLVAIKRIGTKRGEVLWLLQCDCGKTTEVLRGQLNSGRTKSCGCIRAKDLTDQRFCRLVAIKRVGTKRRGALWLLQCDCGNTVEVIASNLNNGTTKSCGCLRKEVAQRQSEFRPWQNIDENSDFAFTASQLRGMKLDAGYREDLKV